MTTKVNGNSFQGSWFERDTSIVHVTATGVDFTADVIGGIPEQVMRIMQTRGTVIGYTVVDATNAHFMFGHAAGAWGTTVPVNTPDVKAELVAAIDGLAGVSASALVVYEGFVGATPATVIHS